MKKRICIVNAHWSNRGDEAALRAIIDELLRRYQDCSIHVIFKDNEKVLQFPYGNNVTCDSAKFLPDHLWQLIAAVMTNGRICANASMKKEIEAMQNQDMILYSPGGAVISDRFWWRKQLEYLLPFLYAGYHRIPMVVAAPSMGPFEKHFWRDFVRRKLLRTPLRLCVREEFSEKYLSKLGVRKNVCTTIDTAFYDMPDMAENERILESDEELSLFLGAYDKVVGMTITDFLWHIEYSKDEELRRNIEKAMKGFIRGRRMEGTGVLLIPQLFGNQNDRDLLKKFQDENTFLLSDKSDAYFQQFLISKLYAVVGMRYHSNIFAAKMGVPFIAVSYEEKMQGFMEMWDMKDYALTLRELSAETLEEKWKALTLDYEVYRSKLKGYRSCWQRKAGETLKSITDILDGE